MMSGTEHNKTWVGPTDERLTEELRKLIPPESKQRKSLSQARVAKAIEPSTGIGKLTVADIGTGPGISPPLVELDVMSRTYHAPQTLVSSDGLFTIEVTPIATLLLRDAADNDVHITLAEPDFSSL